MKELTKTDSPFNVEILNEEETDVYKVLGISEERSDEIAEIAKKSYRDEKYFTDSIKYAVGKMNHVNEVVFVMLCLAKSHAQSNDDIKAKLEFLKLLMQLKK
jgi:hypothetical protein